MAGGHDPLLEWALRESRSGIAAFLDGALDGVERAAAGECIAAGLHIPEGDDWNVAKVIERFAQEPWVLIEWVRRWRGLIIGRNVPSRPGALREARGLRFQPRQPESGSELVLARLLRKRGCGATTSTSSSGRAVGNRPRARNLRRPRRDRPRHRCGGAAIQSGFRAVDRGAFRSVGLAQSLFRSSVPEVHDFLPVGRLRQPGAGARRLQCLWARNGPLQRAMTAATRRRSSRMMPSRR